MRADFTINALQTEALEYLGTWLESCYTYHNVQHTLEVCNAVAEFGSAAALEPEEYEILRIAAIFHDFGYLSAPEDNEALAWQYMQDFLHRWSLPPELGERANELILETVFPYHPVTALGELLCDADIEYIGRSAFTDRALQFRNELQLLGKCFDDRQWWSMELDFLRQNSFFSPECRRSRTAGRIKNIEEVQNILRQIKGQFVE